MEAPSSRVQPGVGDRGMESSNPSEPLQARLDPGDDTFAAFNWFGVNLTFNEATDPVSSASMWDFADVNTDNAVVEKPTSSLAISDSGEIPLGLNQFSPGIEDDLLFLPEQPYQPKERPADFQEEKGAEAEDLLSSMTFSDFHWEPIELDCPSLPIMENALKSFALATNTLIPSVSQGRAVRKPVTRRNQMPPPARRALEKQFMRNPYPSPAEMCQLVKATDCEERKNRTWFNNARTRRAKSTTGNSDTQTTIKFSCSDNILQTSNGWTRGRCVYQTVLPSLQLSPHGMLMPWPHAQNRQDRQARQAWCHWSASCETQRNQLQCRTSKKHLPATTCNYEAYLVQYLSLNLWHVSNRGQH